MLRYVRAWLLSKVSDFKSGWFCAELAISLPAPLTKDRVDIRSNDYVALRQTLSKAYMPIYCQKAKIDRLSNVIVGYSRDFIYSIEGRKILWGYTLCFTFEEASRTAISVLKYVMLPRLRTASIMSTDERPIVYLGSKNCTYFYHYLNDYLPRLVGFLEYCRDSGRMATIILPKFADKGFIRDSLEVLRDTFSFDIYWASRDMLIEGPSYSVGMGFYTGNISRGFPFTLEKKLCFIQENVSKNRVDNHHKLLLMRDRESKGSFDMSTTRRMLIRAAEESFGVIYLGALDLRRQLDILRNADTIIAVHGADLTLVPYTVMPDSIVIEIMDRGWNNACYARACAQMSIRHYIHFTDMSKTLCNSDRRDSVHLNDGEINTIFYIARTSRPEH